MSAKSQKRMHLESIISLCLLGVLVLIAGGILIRQQRNVDMERFGLAALATQLGTQAEQTQAGGLNLAALAPPGFEPYLATETYTADTLYEKINGKATFYLDSGFVKLLTQRFKSTADESLWMELYLYDMDNIKKAFSVYSRQKRPGTTALPEVHYGYKTANSLFAVHGKCYAELVASSDSDRLIAAMTKVVNTLPDELPLDEATQIPELDFFPAENLASSSFKLYLADTFGFEELTDTLTAQYELAGQNFTAFLSKRKSPRNAAALAEQYCKFLTEAGGNVKPAINKNLEALNCKVLDLYGTTEIVFATGPFVAGVHEAEDQKLAEDLTLTLAGRLREVMSRPGNE